MLTRLRALAARAVALLRRKPRRRVTTIAVVSVKPLTAGTFLARWSQPYVSGDDATDWYVTSTLGTLKVQRDRLTDEIYWCCVLVPAGTTRFDVVTGSNTSPSTGWTAPTLTGLGLRWTGHETPTPSKHFSDFTSTTVQDVLRDGHNERVVRRWVPSKITTVGSGSQLSNEVILGHHVYLHFRADWPDVVEIECLISNAVAEVATNGSGIKNTFFGSMAFTRVDLELPSGWALGAFVERPIPIEDSIPATVNGYVSNAHCFPAKMGTVRRWVIYKTATSGAAQAAADIAQMLGWGRATALGPRSFHTVGAYGPSKSRLPDLDRGSPGGFTRAATDAQALYDTLYNNTASGNSYSSQEPPRLGFFHQVGGLDPAAPGGTDTECFAALLQVQEWMRYVRLYGDRKVDGSGLFLFEKTTGRPLRTSDFGDAYVTAGLGFDIQQSAQYLGMQPFPMYCQNNSGYEYSMPHGYHFLGWINPRWPPHHVSGDSDPPFFRKTWVPTLPTSGVVGSATNPPNWGTAPRSLLDFKCRYRPILEQQLRQTGLLPNGNPQYTSAYAFFADSPFGGSPYDVFTAKDPEDNQHADRMVKKLEASAYLGGDLVSIDVLDMMAEWYALEFSEVGHVPISGAALGVSDAQALNMNPNLFSLKRRLADVQGAPNTCKREVGRGEGWVGSIFATQFALASVSRRNTGYSASRPYGIKKRCEMFYDFIRLSCLSNGASQRIAYPGSSGSENAWGLPTPQYGGQPISRTFSVAQIGLELPISMFALFSLGRQLGRTEFHTTLLAAYRNYTALTGEYVNYSSDPSVFGPPKWWATWHTANQVAIPGQNAENYGGGSGTPGWPNHAVIVELAYRISGSATMLVTANHLGHHATGFPSQTSAVRGAQLLADGSYRGEWDAGLIQLLLDQPGADVPFTPPITNPTISGGASPNPVAAGATVTITATVAPGTNPVSTGLAATVDFSQTGAVDPVYDLLDDGVDPDVTAGDGIYTTEFDTTGVPPGTYILPLVVTDAQSRQGTGNIVLVVSGAGTDPAITTTNTNPNPVVQGGTCVITAAVVFGTSPTSTGVTVKIDLSSVGGSATTSMLDGGVAPDASAGDKVYTVGFTVDAATRVGTHGLLITMTDSQLRVATATVNLTVYETPISGTDPQVIGSIAGAPGVAGQTLTLLGIVTLGTSPTSTGVVVTADVSALGGSSALSLLDTGVSPDVTASDLTFTGNYSVPSSVTPGIYPISFTVTDAQERTSSGKLVVEIVPAFVSTDPQVRPAGSPNPVHIGQVLIITADVILGTSPTSTGVMVIADLSPISGPGAKVLSDSGVFPDVTGSDLRYTGSHFIDPITPTGQFDIQVRVVDAQGRDVRQTFPLFINPPPPPQAIPIPDHPVSAMYDSLTQSVFRIKEGTSDKLIRYIRDGLNAPLLQANVDSFQVDVFDEGGIQPEVAIWSSGRLDAPTQNNDGTVIVKSAVVVDGQSPTRAGHTFEYLLDAAAVGLRGGRAYRVDILFVIIEPAIMVRIQIPMACETAYS